MRKLAWLTCTTLVLTLGACGDDGGSDDNNSTDPSSSSGPSTDPTVTTSMSTTMSTTMTTEDPSSGTDPTDASTGTDPTGSTGPDPDSSSGSGSESGGEPAVCIVDKEDDECTTCTKESCCDTLDACFAIPNCMCVAGCAQMQLAMGMSQEEAIEFCTAGEDAPCEELGAEDGIPVAMLSGCVTGMCGQKGDPCATPA